MRFQRGSTARRLIIITIALGIALFRWLGDTADPPTGRQGNSSETSQPAQMSQGQATLQAAFENQLSGVWVQASGVVDRLLPDDTRGSRHQKFIVQLPDQSTILISHNIDLAQRAPVSLGDTVAFRGKYEWNARGGVVHWTHHDPQAGRAREDRGGWLRVGGTTVR